jgi:hypothetical protein
VKKKKREGWREGGRKREERERDKERREHKLERAQDPPRPRPALRDTEGGGSFDSVTNSDRSSVVIISSQTPLSPPLGHECHQL